MDEGEAHRPVREAISLMRPVLRTTGLAANGQGGSSLDQTPPAGPGDHPRDSPVLEQPRQTVAARNHPTTAKSADEGFPIRIGQPTPDAEARRPEGLAAGARSPTPDGRPAGHDPVGLGQTRTRFNTEPDRGGPSRLSTR